MKNKGKINLLFIIFLITAISCSQDPVTTLIKDEVTWAQKQYEAVFSPNDSIVVFPGEYKSILGIHFIDISGKYLKTLFPNQYALPTSPSWVPDNKIAFSINGNISYFNLDDSSVTTLTETGVDFSCEWSPDGKYIAYTRTICDPDCGVMMYDIENGTSRLVAPFGDHAAWNSASDKIYYYHPLYRTGGELMGSVIKRIDINTGVVDSLKSIFFNSAQVAVPSIIYDLTVSPDEKEVIFTLSYGPPLQFGLWKLDLASKTSRQIAVGGYADYSHDGEKIIYTNTDVNEGGLWIMNRDGSGQRRFTEYQK